MEVETLEKDIAVYSFRVAQQLVRDGFKLLNMELNSKLKGKVVFYFENIEETRDELRDNYGIHIK